VAASRPRNPDPKVRRIVKDEAFESRSPGSVTRQPSLTPIRKHSAPDANELESVPSKRIASDLSGGSGYDGCIGIGSDLARLRCHLRLNRVIEGDALAVVASLAGRKDERKNRKDTPKSSQLVP